MPTLSRILIFPIKSLDGVSVSQARILSGGALESDREFAIVDSQGKVVNAKRTAKIHQLRSQFDLSLRQVTMSIEPPIKRPIESSNPHPHPHTFELDGDRTALAQWLSEFFGFTVTLQQNQVTGFPDDLNSPGPTMISTATLETISGWFEGIDVEELRSRFRTNLEFENAPAFWEDSLYQSQQHQSQLHQTKHPSQPEGRSFSVGNVAMQGINPCQRCVVPTRDQRTGAVTAQFQKTLAIQRQASLPAWADEKMFNHYYRVAVNTRIPASEVGKILKRGDSCKVT